MIQLTLLRGHMQETTSIVGCGCCSDYTTTALHSCVNYPVRWLSLNFPKDRSFLHIANFVLVLG